MSVERVELDQLTAWRIRYNGNELLITEQGAQVLRFGRDGQPPIIWLSPEAQYLPGNSIRGGVPVCWPWFGDLQRNPAAVQAHYQGKVAPAHGLVRGLDWQLLEITEQYAEVLIRFALDTREHPLPGWPHAAQLQLDIHLSDQLRMRLQTQNLGDQTLHLSQALHTYFAVSDIRQAHVTGLEGCSFLDTLQGWRSRTQDGPLDFAGETDSIYLGQLQHLSIVDPLWQRRIHIHSRGSHSAVLWNPWIDKSLRLSHFAQDAWQNMLCVETANILDDAVALAPGATQRLEVTLYSEALSD